MAAEILSGSTNAAYINNTGQNVRIIINHMARLQAISWAGNSVTLPTGVTSTTAYSPNTWVSGVKQNYSCGLTINSSTTLGSYGEYNGGDVFSGVDVDAYYSYSSGSQSDIRKVDAGLSQSNKPIFYGSASRATIPTKIFLAPGQSFSATCGPYNILVIKEDGT